MNNIEWTEEHTDYAKEVMKQGTWAVINPTDILRAIKDIHQLGGIISGEKYLELSEDYGGNENQNFRSALENLNITKKNNDGLYEFTQNGRKLGCYSGRELASVVEDLGVSSPQALNLLGHNFLLHAPESLSFCCQLNPIGIPKEVIKHDLLDHYLFNQKLNEFKIDNLFHILAYFNVIEEKKLGYGIKNAPPALTYYYMVSYYLFLASNKVGSEVDAKDLKRAVDFLMPNRIEDYRVLGLHNHPIEGWGLRLAWMKTESFNRLLQVGLISPLSIARILRNIIKDDNNPSQKYAYETLKTLKNEVLKNASRFRGEPLNFTEVLREFEID